jgi:hypothetical protein
MQQINRAVSSRLGGVHLFVTDMDEDMVPFSGQYPVGMRFYYKLTEDDRRHAGQIVLDGVLGVMLEPDDFGLPRGAAAFRQAIAEAAIGEMLDVEGLQPFRIDAGTAVIVPALPLVTDRLRDRAPASAEDIEAYIAGKAFAGFEFAQEHVVLSSADQVRLRVSAQRLRQVAALYHGELWEVTETPRGPRVRPLSRLVQDFRAGRRGAARSQLILQIQGQLTAPRYRSARTHFDKSVGFCSATPPDWENAAKEAISGLESLALLISGTTGTLGSAIKTLRASNRLNPAVLKILDGLRASPANHRGCVTGIRARLHCLRRRVNLWSTRPRLVLSCS